MGYWVRFYLFLPRVFWLMAVLFRRHPFNSVNTISWITRHEMPREI